MATRQEVLVRAFAFAQHMPLDPYANDSVQRTGIERLMRASTNPETRGQLVDRLTTETVTIMGLLDETEPLEEYRHTDLASFFWIDPPESARQDRESDPRRAYLVMGPGDVIKFDKTFGEIRAWADAYLLTRDTGYLFCPAELAPFAYLATESLIRLEYGVRTPLTMLRQAKQDPNQIDAKRRRLSARNYYADKPSDLRPLPRPLTTPDADRRLHNIADQFGGYQGPTLG